MFSQEPERYIHYLPKTTLNEEPKIQGKHKPKNIIEPCQLNPKYNPNIAYVKHTYPSLPQPLEDHKLGIFDATQDAPYIHSLVSNQRIQRMDNFPKQIKPENKQYKNVFKSEYQDQLKLRDKLEFKFGEAETKEYIQPVTSSAHNPRFMEYRQIKQVEEHDYSQNQGELRGEKQFIPVQEKIKSKRQQYDAIFEQKLQQQQKQYNNVQNDSKRVKFSQLKNKTTVVK